MSQKPKQKAHVEFTLNGEAVEGPFAPHKTLLEVLPEDLKLTGTKHGCELGECGTCGVFPDRRPLLSWLVVGIEAEGRWVETVGGVVAEEGQRPLRECVVHPGAAQCCYFAPRFLVVG